MQGFLFPALFIKSTTLVILDDTEQIQEDFSFDGVFIIELGACFYFQIRFKSQFSSKEDVEQYRMDPNNIHHTHEESIAKKECPYLRYVIGTG